MRLESIGGGLAVAQTADFRFGTDAVLLAAFGECRKAGERVCDLGTGCGILPFLLQNRAHPPAYICGVDIQAEAIALCHAANEKNNCENMTFLQADWCHPERIAPPGSFDRVLCNPPYFEGGRVNDSQARTIARHAKETTLFEVCACARYLLKYGGKLCMCHRPDHLATLFAAMRDNGLEPKCLQMVQSAAAAPVQLVLVQAIKGGKAGLQIPPAWLLDHPQTHDMIYGMYKNN